MAFHQAQYILNEFSTPSIRSNHNSVLSRDNGPVNNITPNGVKYVFQRLFTICVKTNAASGICLVLKYLHLSFLCLVCAVNQRAVVRAMWTPVTPRTKVRGVALQPWPTAPRHVRKPQREAPQSPRPKHKRNTRFPSITPNTSPARPQQQLWTKSMKTCHRTLP